MNNFLIKEELQGKIGQPKMSKQALQDIITLTYGLF